MGWEFEALAPRGVLRVALNHANFLLVTAPAPDAVGVAPDLGRELARRLHVPLEFVGYRTAGDVAEAAARDEWDVAFIGSDPARAGQVLFTDPYVEIEATYLVSEASSITQIVEVDRPGVAVASAEHSAYDLFLQRTLRNATLSHAPGLPESEALFVKAQLEVMAGLRPHLLQVASRVPGSRILDGRFMAVQQAIGVPRHRAAGFPQVATYCNDVRLSGFLAGLIALHGVAGLSIPTTR